MRGDGDARAVIFHDLQLDYLRLITSDQKADLHGALLDAVAGDLPRDDSGAPVWSSLDKRE